jgi:hypothetical protein
LRLPHISVTVLGPQHLRICDPTLICVTAFFALYQQVDHHHCQLTNL